MKSKKNYPEDQLQKQVAQFLWRQYPKVLWTHPPNGGSRNMLEAVKLKAMGTRRGVPDILIFHGNGDYVGLALELKIKPNKPSPEQLEWLAKLMMNRWHTKVCYDLDDAMKTINEYFKIQ